MTPRQAVASGPARVKNCSANMAPINAVGRRLVRPVRTRHLSGPSVQQRVSTQGLRVVPLHHPLPPQAGNGAHALAKVAASRAPLLRVPLLTPAPLTQLRPVHLMCARRAPIGPPPLSSPPHVKTGNSFCCGGGERWLLYPGGHPAGRGRNCLPSWWPPIALCDAGGGAKGREYGIRRSG